MNETPPKPDTRFRNSLVKRNTALIRPDLTAPDHPNTSGNCPDAHNTLRRRPAALGAPFGASSLPQARTAIPESRLKSAAMGAAAPAPSLEGVVVPHDGRFPRLGSSLRANAER